MAAASNHNNHDSLADFTTDFRVLLLSGMALVIGAISALVASALLWLIALITNISFFHTWSANAQLTPQDAHFGPWVIVVPVVGALIIGLMARYGSEKIRGHGIPEALEAILIGQSRMQPKVAILKPVSSAISIGTGGPFGAEGPIIMTGGAFGSLFAQLFHLSSAERKTLLVAGAAAGMTAIFGTPVAAVLLAVEVMLFEWKPRSFIPVAAAAAMAWALRDRMPLLTPAPIFPIPAHAALSGWELAMALAVGLTAGLASSVLTNLVYALEDAFARLPIHWMWWPAIGAVFVGIGGYLDPRVLGVGYGLIHSMLLGKMIGVAVLGLLIGKALVWSVALGSGTSGGVLAPLLIVGGALGAFLSKWIGVGDPSLWAMVGMAAIMGGTMRAPLTGMVFLLELTHDLNTLPAVMIGSVAALGVTVLILRRSILTEKIARRGLHISCEYSVDVFNLLRVSEVMDKNPPIIQENLPLTQFSELIAKGHPGLARRQGTLIVDNQGLLAGIITRGDVVRALQGKRASEMTVLQAGTQNPTVTYSDELLCDAITKMLNHDVGRLPVVERSNPKVIVGYLGRANIMAARVKHIQEESVRARGLVGAD
ncbi:MAG TPA: chloride channel protein [Verrucomicrobiae bacterium]|nr:chloride channel protein [Verrucomicrobiae bacterium]